MKKICLLIIGLLALNSFGQSKYSINTGKNHQPIKITEKGANAILVEASFDEINFEKITTKGGDFTKIIIKGFGTAKSIGNPNIPQTRKLIEAPQGATYDIKVIDYTSKEYNLSELGVHNPIIPVQKSVYKNRPQDSGDFVINKETYAANKMYGFDLVRVIDIGQMRAQRLANVAISPIEYNPVTNIIKVYNNIKVEVTFKNADYAKTKRIKAATASPHFDKVYNQVGNNKNIALKASKSSAVSATIKYVIVADRKFEQALKPFIRWKTQKGFNVITAYTDDIGKTPETIKSYLQNLYDAGTATDPAPTYALLVGDLEEIPMWKGRVLWFEPGPAFPDGNYYWTDIYYFDYTNDDVPDIYYGRFTANTVEQLQNQIDKTIKYEKYELDNPSYLNNALMIAGKDVNPTDEISTKNANGSVYYLEHYINQENGFNVMSYKNPNPSNAKDEIISKFSEGTGFAYYTGHGITEGWQDPAFRYTDVGGLSNNGKYGLGIGNCCHSARFNMKNNFGENMVRVKDKGMYAYIGASHLSIWSEDCWWLYGNGDIVAEPEYDSTIGVVDLLFHKNGESKDKWVETNSQIIFGGNLAVAESESTNDTYYWEIYHLLGDPSSMTYLGVPDIMNINHSSVVALGATSFTIQAEEDAYIGLSKDGVLVAAGKVDSSGSIELIFDAQNTVGTLDIVISKHNKQPYISTATIGGQEVTPVAEFSASQREIVKGKEIQFSDSSTNGPTSWEWVFEGGTPATSTERNPKITYTNLGVYKVTLKATNGAGSDTKSEEEYITVNEGTTNEQYCDSYSSNHSLEWIKEVIIGNFTNPSDAMGYSDFTSETIVIKTSTTDITLTPGFSGNAGTESGYSNTVTISTAVESGKVTLTINHDEFASEVGFELKDESGKIIASYNYYTTLANEITIEEFDLPKGCYTLKMTDAASDGICCKFGNGFYTLKDQDGKILASGAEYGAEEVTNFCLGTNRETPDSDLVKVNIDNNEKIKVYLDPNPVHEDQVLNLRFSNSDYFSEFVIIDQLGRVIMKREIMDHKNVIIRTDTLPAGLFFIKLRGIKKSVTIKFIKE